MTAHQLLFATILFFTPALSLADEVFFVTQSRQYNGQDVPGASGNDQLDDTLAILAAIEAAADSDDSGIKYVEFPEGTYYISQPICLAELEDVTLRGAGKSKTYIHPSTLAANPLFVIEGSTNCGLCDMTIDGQAEDLYDIPVTEDSEPTSRPGQVGVFIYGSEACFVEYVRFRDLGKAEPIYGTHYTLPGGMHILVAATESGYEHKGENRMLKNAIYTPYIFGPGHGRPSIGTWIRYCRFDDRNVDSGQPPVAKANFGIRLLTHFQSPDELTNHVSETLVHQCVFDGGFHWNAIELAGHGTTDNLVKHSTFLDCLQTPLDIDKGASYNTFKLNTVDGVYPRSPIVQRKRGKQPLTWVFAVRVQGYNEPEHFSIGNKILENTISKVEGNASGTGGILLSRAKATTMASNTITDRPQWTPDSFGPKDPAAAIKVRFHVWNAVLRDNVFPIGDDATRRDYVTLANFPGARVGTGETINRPANLLLTNLPVSDGAELPTDTDAQTSPTAHAPYKLYYSELNGSALSGQITDYRLVPNPPSP